MTTTARSITTNLTKAVGILLGIVVLSTQVAHAAPPPAGYVSWRVEDSVNANDIGDVPFRHGYWDAATDKGFGIDKMRNKHGVTNLAMVKYILNYGTKERKPGEMQDDDAQYGTQIRARLSITTQFCPTDPYTGKKICGDVKGPFKMIAVVEDEEHDFYWAGRASMKPDPNNPGTVDPSNPLILNGADYVTDERIVGIVTCFEEEVDGKVSKPVNDWQDRTVWT